MPAWLSTLLSIVGALVLVWLLLVAVLLVQARRRGHDFDVRGVLRLVPDVIRLMKRLATSSDVPIGTRIVLGVLLLYLLSPIDLIPDFIPVLGYADDAIIVALALRFAVHRAGRPTLERLWPGRPDGLRALLTLCGIQDEEARPSRD